MAFGPGWADQGSMMSSIAQARARREASERELDADVQGGQRTGQSIGTLVGTAASVIPGPHQPFAPLIIAGSREVGGQIGRKAAGGEFGYGSKAEGAQAALGVTNAGLQAAEEDAFLAKMEEITGSPELWTAYEAMPTPLQQRMRQRPEVFDSWYEGGMWRP
jgi:hypothetical protein